MPLVSQRSGQATLETVCSRWAAVCALGWTPPVAASRLAGRSRSGTSLGAGGVLVSRGRRGLVEPVGWGLSESDARPGPGPDAWLWSRSARSFVGQARPDRTPMVRSG